MADIVLPRWRLGATTVPRSLRRAKALDWTDATKVNWLIRYTFYAFVFSLPFEEALITGGTTLPKLFGLALAGFALLQPLVCYKFPPKAFWWFGVYLLVFAGWSLYLHVVPPDVPNFGTVVTQQFVRLVQLLALFWISYNLLKQERIFNGTLWALTAATMLLACLQLAGVTSDVSKAGRMAAFEGNPNGLATVLSLGLLALFGIGYGREKYDWKGLVLFWLGSGIIAVAMVQTGSRGGVVAVIGALSVFFLRGKNLATKVKFGAIAFLGVVVLVVASYQIEAVRVRWEKTFYDQDFAGRQKIYPESIGMILERSVLGWGPVVHIWELGPRVGKPYRDEHNVYLWILAEVGLVGSIPFFGGLWLCWRAAWGARHGMQGILPLVMLLFLLAASMKGTLHKNKYFWVILSMAVAARSYNAVQSRLKIAGPTAYAGFPPARRKHKLPKMPAQGLLRKHW